MIQTAARRANVAPGGVAERQRAAGVLPEDFAIEADKHMGVFDGCRTRMRNSDYG